MIDRITVTCHKCGKYAFDAVRRHGWTLDMIPGQEHSDSCSCRPETGNMLLWEDSRLPGGLIDYITQLDQTAHSIMYVQTSIINALHKVCEDNGLYGVTVTPPRGLTSGT